MTEEKQQKKAHAESHEEAQPATPIVKPQNRIDALKQRHQDTEDRLDAEAEERKRFAKEAEERRDAAIQRERDLQI